MGNDVLLLAERLSKTFGTGRNQVMAVREVSFAVRRGEVVLVMGPSGSGKTTLLLLLGALLHPSSGRIVLDGIDISALSEGRLPAVRLRHVGFIFQDFNLLSALNARENVEVVLNLAGRNGQKARTQALALLTDLGLGDRAEFRPSQLSGGEKQRVAIARALANNPGLILADEPTANLDSRAGQLVMQLLGQIAHEQGRSVVVCSHDQRIRQVADRVLWLEDGAIVAEEAGERPS